MFTRSGRLWLILLLVGLLAGLPASCGPAASPAVSPVATPTPGAQPAVDPVALLRQVAADPGAYAGQRVTVEGTLAAVGQMPNPRFFLVGTADERLEVSAWAPTEVIQPPAGGEAPKAMSYYVGKRLRLIGTVEQTEQGFILQVIDAQEL